jgi:hypothetical protein
MRLALVISLLTAALMVSSAASCGARMCSPQNCPTGCCTEAGVCVAGGENASCGNAGNTCTNCVASGLICGDGACVSLNTGGGAGGGTGTGGGTATGGGAGGCTRTPVECSDQAIQQLDLKMTVASGLINTTADGSGFKSTIDATGGGFPPTESYVYARFTETGLEKLPISDIAALDSMDWDIAFRRFVIRINSGDSGPACVAAEVQPQGTTYASVTAVPAAFLPEGDDFLTRAPACGFVDDGSGLGTSPRTYLSTFYAYTGCVAMSGRVYVLRTQFGRHVKLTVTTYYATEAAQQTCNTTSASGGALGGTIRVRYQYLD